MRRGGSAKASGKRARKRRSVAFFAQLTDPQIADEMSPARVDFVDPAGGALKSAHRPQEALGPQTFDAIVRNVNANRRSAVKDGKGRRATLGFAITTGDLADNQQLNETRWFRTVLDGGRVDPFSGKPVGAANPCPGATPDVLARLDADVAARRYTGLQDYDDWRGARNDLYGGYWDPDEAAATGGLYAAFPRYPGLMDRAQAPFDAAGLDVPWYISRGNHDGLVQGNAAASTDLFRAIAVGCLKVFPTPEVDPALFAGADESALFRRFSDPAFISSLLAGGRTGPAGPGPPDRVQAGVPRAHARGRPQGARLRGHEREGAAPLQGHGELLRDEPGRGLRMISLDTVAEGGGQNGNLDDPQYRWLKRELRKAKRRDRLVVLFGHHTLETLSNATADEAAGACQPAAEPGCDTDPRRSTPLHLGTTGKRSIKALLAANRNVIAYVAGHTHVNEVEFVGGRRGGGFWQINTASHIDWPQQSRLIQVMDNRDGTLSLFGTMLESAAPEAAPPPGDALGLSLGQLVSLSRTLSYNDPQREGAEGSGDTEEKAGGVDDRNVELLVRDPR